MAKEYVPIFYDWVKVTEELNDQEKGRLIDAIVLYATGGDWQERIKGNERYLFPAFREQINRNENISKARAAAGAIGGTANGIKDKQTEANGSKPKQTEAKSLKEKEKEKENKKENDQCVREEAERFERFWAAYPRHENRQKAQAAFARLHPDETMLESMIRAIERQKQSVQWQEDGGRYIPHPTTWLNGRRWEDEPPKRTVARGTVIAQQYDQRDYSGDEESVDEMMERLMSLTGQQDTDEALRRATQ